MIGVPFWALVDSNQPKPNNEVDEFFNVTYPKIWNEAYDFGKEARESGLPRACNLTGEQFCYCSSDENIKILKVYRSAWEQGWDGVRFGCVKDDE